MKVRFIALAGLASLACAGAQAQSIASAEAVTQILAHNAQEEAAIGRDIASGQLDGRTAALLEAQLARIYRMEAIALDMGAPAAAMQRVAAEQELGLVGPQQPGRGDAARALARLRTQQARVAAERGAAQQQAIAARWAEGSLSADKAAALENAQARLAETQMLLDRNGLDAVEQALRMQHLQNIQDWAIAHGSPVF